MSSNLPRFRNRRERKKRRKNPTAKSLKATEDGHSAAHAEVSGVALGNVKHNKSTGQSGKNTSKNTSKNKDKKVDAVASKQHLLTCSPDSNLLSKGKTHSASTESKKKRKRKRRVGKDNKDSFAKCGQVPKLNPQKRQLLDSDAPQGKKQKIGVENEAKPVADLASTKIEVKAKKDRKVAKPNSKRVWKNGKWKKRKVTKIVPAEKTEEKSPTLERNQKEMKKMNNSSGESQVSIKPKQISSNWEALKKKYNIPEKKKEEEPWQIVKYSGNKRRHYNEDSPKDESGVWFDDVDPALIELEEAASHQSIQQSSDSTSVGSKGNNQSTTKGAAKLVEGAADKLTKYVAMDCEMVGIGYNGEKSMLARISIVNQYGECIYDKHVSPRERVTDYRTHVSGIRPADIKQGENFMKVQKEVYEVIKGRILVGHALKNDLTVLFLSHPKFDIRDTSTYKPFKDLFKGNKPSLKKLSEAVLKIKIQDGEHNSVEDAQATMQLYMLHRKQWEKSLQKFKKAKPRK